MREPTRISWRMLTGNKFRCALLSEMFSDAGCIKMQSTRKTGDAVKSVFEVMYDRDYGLKVLLIKIVKPLAVMGREEVIELINEAWDMYEKESVV
jgi:predicted GTPase